MRDLSLANVRGIEAFPQISVRILCEICIRIVLVAMHFQIFNNVAAFLLGELRPDHTILWRGVRFPKHIDMSLAEFVPHIGIPRDRSIEPETVLSGGLCAEAEIDGIEFARADEKLFIAPVRRQPQLVDRGHRTVMQEGSSGPDGA